MSSPEAMVLSMYARVLRACVSAKRSRRVPFGEVAMSRDAHREAEAHCMRGKGYTSHENYVRLQLTIAWRMAE